MSEERIKKLEEEVKELKEYIADQAVVNVPFSKWVERKTALTKTPTPNLVKESRAPEPGTTVD